jgi:indole-3-glycerol phosphate synthase
MRARRRVLHLIRDTTLEKKERCGELPDKTMSSILEEIVENKIREIAEQRVEKPTAELMRDVEKAPPVRDFAAALRAAKPAIIAEVKQRSPSAGVFREDFDHLQRAGQYEAAGAVALSVLTDETYFGGNLEIFAKIRRSSQVPCMVKDFVVDRYQLFAARAAGADAYLLIARILDRDLAGELLDVGSFLGMHCLFEIYSDEEADLAFELGVKIIGINNRDLASFETDLGTSSRLAARITGDRIGVALSGIKNGDDIKGLQKQGINAFLIGEALSRADDPKSKIMELTA